MKKILAIIVIAMLFAGCLSQGTGFNRSKANFPCPDGSNAYSSSECPKPVQTNAIVSTASANSQQATGPDKGIIFIAQDQFVVGQPVTVKIRNEGTRNYSLGGVPSWAMNIKLENGTEVNLLRDGLPFDLAGINVIEPGQETTLFNKSIYVCINPSDSTSWCKDSELAPPGNYVLSAVFKPTKISKIRDYKGDEIEVVEEDDSLPPSSPNKTITLVEENSQQASGPDKGIIFVAQDTYPLRSRITIKVRNEGRVNYSIGKFPAYFFSLKTENGTKFSPNDVGGFLIPEWQEILAPGQEKILFDGMLTIGCRQVITVPFYGCSEYITAPPGKYFLSAVFKPVKIKSERDAKGNIIEAIEEDNALPPSAINKTITLVTG